MRNKTFIINTFAKKNTHDKAASSKAINHQMQKENKKRNKEKTFWRTEAVTETGH